MSAAASLPSPPSGPPGHSNGARTPSFNGASERTFEHIQDLQARAQGGYNERDPPAKLLNVAGASLQQAKALLDSRRPDLAFVEYLRAYEIAIDVIPRSGKMIDMDLDQGWDRQYKYVKSTLVSWNSQYMAIKGIIENDNKRSQVLPRGYQPQIGHARSQSESQREYATKLPYPQSNAEYPSPNGQGAHKVKPSVSPKPESLHGRALSQGGAALNGSHRSSNTKSDALNDRFARLRMPSGGVETSRPDSRGSTSSVHSSPISMPAAADWNGSYSFDAPAKSNGVNGKPLGPRGMPSGGPILPAKLPLDTSLAAAMPKAPSPTYSPARNMHTTGNVAPPRHSARSLASSEYRKSSTASSVASLRAPNGARDSGDYFPQTDDKNTVSMPTSGPSQNIKETHCSTERLFDYLPRFSVLLIDVRPRADFDQGHIYSQNVMCIEPMSLQPGMSAEQLLESLILSPDLEQELFDNRHLFDLVVYYDASTQSDRYLSGPVDERETKLKCLHEALYDFNQEKPLRQPPMLLVGGIDAWVDLVGQQALASSNTLSRAKPGRPISRRPMATHGGSQLRLPKRRVQDYAPLGQDEEKEWLDRARQESVNVPQQSVPEEADEEIDEEEAERERLSRAAIDEFNQRYPDASAIDSQPGFMSSQMPSRKPPVPPAKIPDYPVAPAKPQYDQVPARPAPAAPRMSYTGVSERAASQSTFAGRSDGLMPYVPPKLRSSTMTLPKTGLINFGVTCYMNSTIQALSATTPLSILFLSDEFKRMVVRNWKGSKGVMPELYSNLIRSMWKGDVSCIKPTTFSKFCGRLNADWTSGEQQDAKQFLEFMVECLHEDLNGNFNRSILQNLTPQQEEFRESLPKYLASKREWQRHRHRENSPIYDLFGGQTMSRLRCRTCSFVSTTWEFFSSISVEIPHSGSATLDQCLAQFCRDEALRGEESWKCPRCNVTREATKKITFTRLPQYLIIHLKRFRTDAYGRPAHKVHAVIDFPLRNLDMSPYTLPPPDANEQQRIAQSAAAPEKVPDPAMTPPYVYDAYAVLQHIGGDLSRGHYTTAVRDRMKKVWRSYNDTIVRDMPDHPSGLQNKEAYILFYERTAPAGDGGRL